MGVSCPSLTWRHFGRCGPGKLGESCSLSGWVRPRRPSSSCAIAARGDAELGAEAVDEVGEVLEANIERNVRDGCPAADKPSRRLAEPRAQQPLVRRDASHTLEGAQEVIG